MQEQGDSGADRYVWNTFCFDFEGFREYFVKAGPAVLWHGGVWGLVALVWGTLPCVLLGIAVLDSSDGRPQAVAVAVFCFCLPLVLAGTSVDKIYRHYHPKWRGFGGEVQIALVFERLRAGRPLAIFDDIFGDFKRANRLAVKDKEAGRAFVGSARPFEVMFSTRIGDDGIYLGHAQKYFVTDYSEVRSVLETKNLLIVRNGDMEDIALSKDAFGGASPEGVKAYIRAKRRGKDASLQDCAYGRV